MVSWNGRRGLGAAPANPLEAMEDLQLPEDVRDIWERGAATVIDALRRYRCTPSLGGGTLLAARWNGHRRSFDIDLRVTTRDGHRLLRAARDAAVAARLTVAGGRIEAAGAPEGAFWRVSFPDTGVGAVQQRIETWARNPEPEGAETAGRVNGRTMPLQSTGQILRGKLQRTGALAARDIFDIKLAAKRDPTALAIAVNMLGEKDFERRMRAWTENGSIVAGRAPRQIAGPPPEERATWGTLAEDAAAGCRAARYRMVHFAIEPTILRFEYATRGTHAGEHVIDRRTAGADARRCGVADWLEANGHDIDELIGRCRAGQGARKRIALLDSGESGA